MNKFLISFILIALTTFFLRFIALDKAPPHLSNDEISIAYDAYSISHTSRDSHNHFLPLSFQSHNTYKAPLSIYLTIPSVTLLGNTDYAARLPSALLGSLTVLFLGLLIYELTKKSSLALISSLVLATTPLHVYSSRMLLETNIALFFVVLGLYLFYYGLNHQKNFLFSLSFFSFALSMYTYHTQWGFTPLILLTLGLLNFKKLITKKTAYLGALLFLLLLTPLFLNYLQNLGTTARANTEIILMDPYVVKHFENPILNPLQKSQVVIQVFINNYSNYLNPSYLFFTGLNLFPASDPFQVGVFLFSLLPAFLIGLFNIKKYYANHSKFIFSFLLLSPLIPSLTWGEVSNFRNLLTVAPISIVISVGILVIWNFLKTNFYLKLASIFLVIFSFIHFLIFYFLIFPFENGINFQYGYKQIAQVLDSKYSHYPKVVIDPRFGPRGQYNGVPSLYIPYYTHLDPKKLLAGQTQNRTFFFDKYEIKEINWTIEASHSGTIYILPVANPPTPLQGFTKLETINLPNQTPSFEIYEYNKPQ